MRENYCLRELILRSKVPIVFRKRLNWEILNWNLEHWSLLFKDKLFPFRCGEKYCQEKPVWENSCDIEYHTMDEFIKFCCNEKIVKNKWWYFDYKHIAKFFGDNIKVFNCVTWADLGFPEKTAEDSTIWVGSVGAHTPCHVDSYGFNIIAQIYGSKRWLLFPPSETVNLKPTRVPYEESSIFSEINFSCSKRIEDLRSKYCYLVDLNPGDVLFVPSRWWHYVENISTAISINTWIPYEKDDESRLEESLVRFFISSIARELSDGVKKVLLNPNELDIEDNSVVLKIINYCSTKVDVNKLESPIYQESLNYHYQCHIHKYDFLKKISISDLKSKMEDLSICCKLNLAPPESSSNADLSNIHLINVVNAFCHPDIIKQVKNNLLRKNKFYN